MNIKTVYSEITNRCNLNCATCYNRSGLNKVTREMTLEQIEQILAFGMRHGARRFLFSGGEPSLHSDFHGLLALLDRRPDLEFGFVTNGTVHDAVWIDFLNSHDNVTLQVSLDGADEESNRLTRGAGSFARAVEFVKKIHLPTQKPLLKMVISKNNLSRVEDFYRLAVTLGCMPEFAFIYRSGNGSDDWESKAPSAQEKLAVLKLVKRLNEEYGLDAYLPRCTVRCPFSAGAEQMSVCIKTNGRIQPCQALYGDAYSLGNVFDLCEDELLARTDALVELARARVGTDYGCEKCLLRAGCGKGCMAEAANLFGNPLADDGACLFRKLEFLDTYVKAGGKHG
ncbi:MAG: radical SAM protein [Clostridia bacterium]|nr:radical SAM protein [Clostridia bacterium]